MKTPRAGYHWARAPWQPSAAQRRVLEGVAAGDSNPTIAQRLGLSPETVKWHVSELLAETGCADRAELAAWWQDTQQARVGGRAYPLALLLAAAALLVAAVTLAAGLVVLFVAPSGARSASHARRAVAAPTATPPSAEGTPAPTAPLVPLLVFSSGPNPVPGPNGVAVDPQGNVYVGEAALADHILVFDRGGTLLRSFGGTRGSGPGEFNYITGLALDAAGNIYVTEFHNQRVQKFDSAGHYLQEIATEPPDGPASVVVDRAGNIYVASLYFYDHAVQVFDSGGHLLRAWGPPGSGDGEFIGGAGQLALDAQGNVYVSDPKSYRVQKFAPDGTLLQAFGGQFGTGAGQFIDGPYGVAVDERGNVYGSTTNGVIQQFAPNGQPLNRWTDTGASRILLCDGAGHLFVKDNDTSTVIEYRLP
jgi:sugar lactone lactonase YvrE/DNA-binding CsgD family transcriptional regulator